MEDQVSKQANTESDSSNMFAVENREDGTLDDYDSGDMHANTSSPAAETTESPHNPRHLCNTRTLHPDHKFVRNRNPAYLSATESASPRNEQNPNPNPMYKSSSTDEEPRSLQDDDISSGMTPVSVGPKAASDEDDGRSIQPQVVAHDEDDKTATCPTHSDTQHQEDMEDVLPACGLTAYCDDDTCSIQPNAVRYGGNRSDDCGKPYNVRYRGNGNDDSIQPYAVRYKGPEDDDCGQPCTVRFRRNGSNGDNMSPNSGTVTNADVDIQPYAVAYSEQSDMGHTAAMQRNEETPAAPSSGDDVPAPGRPDGNSPAKGVPHPPGMMYANPMYAQNKEYGCLTITVFLVLFIAGWACVGVYFSTGFNRNKKPQSGTDTTHIIGHQAVNTTINTGQPAFDTTYTPVQSALYATYTVTPGQSAGPATYAPGQSPGDTTYTPGEVQIPSTESQNGGDVGAQTTVFGGEGSERGKFKDSLGVAVSANGEIFVADRKNQRVQVFNMRGAFLHVFPVLVSPFGGRGMFPCDVTITQDGRLMVLGTDRLADPESAYVAEYNQQGVRRTSLPRRPPYTTLQSRCSAIAVHRRKGVVLAGQTAIIQLLPDGKKDELADSRVASVLTGDILVTGTELSVVRIGRHLFKFGKPLGAPRGDCTVVSGRRGRIIVADAERGRLDMFSTRGKFLRTIGSIDYPWGVALGPQGQLVVTNPSNNTVTIFHV